MPLKHQQSAAGFVANAGVYVAWLHNRMSHRAVRVEWDYKLSGLLAAGLSWKLVNVTPKWST